MRAVATAYPPTGYDASESDRGGFARDVFVTIQDPPEELRAGMTASGKIAVK